MSFVYVRCFTSHDFIDKSSTNSRRGLMWIITLIWSDFPLSFSFWVEEAPNTEKWWFHHHCLVWLRRLGLVAFLCIAVSCSISKILNNHVAAHQLKQFPSVEMKIITNRPKINWDLFVFFSSTRSLESKFEIIDRLNNNSNADRPWCLNEDLLCFSRAICWAVQIFFIQSFAK